MDVYVNNGEKQPGCDDRILELTNSADKLVTMINIPGLKNSSFNLYLVLT